MFGSPQSISASLSFSYYSVSVDVSTASSLDHSSSPGLVDNHSHLPRLFRQQLSPHIRYSLPLLYLFQDCLHPCCYFCHQNHHHYYYCRQSALSVFIFFFCYLVVIHISSTCSANRWYSILAACSNGITACNSSV